MLLNILLQLSGIIAQLLEYFCSHFMLLLFYQSLGIYWISLTPMISCVFVDIYLCLISCVFFLPVSAGIDFVRLYIVRPADVLYCIRPIISSVVHCWFVTHRTVRLDPSFVAAWLVAILRSCCNSYRQWVDVSSYISFNCHKGSH